MQLVKEVYLLTKKFPKEELYALTSQTKRAAVSVPSNIAVMVEIITEEEFNKIIPALEKALQVLNGFINYNQKADLK